MFWSQKHYFGDEGKFKKNNEHDTNFNNYHTHSIAKKFQYNNKSFIYTYELI